MSNPVVTLSDIETFWSDGVVCLRGVLPTSLLEAMSAPVEEAIVGTASADLTEMSRAIAESGERILTDDGQENGLARGRFLSGVDHWRDQVEFRNFALRSPLAAIVGALLGAQNVRLYEDSVLVKEPGTIERTAWHQDLGYFHVQGEQLCTTWCPLDAVTADTGAVLFVKGSHRWDATFRPNLFVSEMAIPGTEGELVPDIDALAAAGEVELISFDTAPGDITVHHARTLHAAGGNHSATVRRRAISVRYCGDDARVLMRPGAPLKPSQRELVDGAVLGDDSPLAWTGQE